MSKLERYRLLRASTRTLNQVIIPSTSSSTFFITASTFATTASACSLHHHNNSNRNTMNMLPNTASMSVNFHTSSNLSGGDSHAPPRHGSFLDRTYVEKKLLRIISNVDKIDKSKLNSRSTYAELGLDSLDEVELNITIEDEFVVDIEDHKAVEIDSIPKMVEYLANHPFAM